jgi:hypothetical protein
MAETPTEFDDSAKHTAATLKDGLEICLLNRDFGNLSNPPNPGLPIESAGTIGLPSSDRDSQAIVSASPKLRTKRAESVFNNTNRGNKWEISARNFEFQNPAWQPFLDSVVERATVGLGVDVNRKAVTAELHSLSLSEKGAVFKEKPSQFFPTDPIYFVQGNTALLAWEMCTVYLGLSLLRFHPSMMVERMFEIGHVTFPNPLNQPFHKLQFEIYLGFTLPPIRMKW